MKEIRFVDIGEGITEGHFQRWLVKDGDAVKEDQPLAQIETDKAVVNVPSPISGNIKTVAKENSDIKVGDTIAFVGTLEELSAAKPQQQSAPVAQSAKPAMQPSAAQQGIEIIAAPSVRKLAHDSNIDISKVKGTGPEGRITESDIRNYVSNSGSAAPQAQSGGPTERVQMSQVRKTIAKNMELSNTIPRAAHMELINADLLYSSTMKAKVAAAQQGIKVTFLSFIIKATVAALKDNPNVNSSYDRDRQEIILKRYYNIGIAAESKDGLKVIVVKDADKKSIIELAKTIQDLHNKVLDNTISINEMKDSTFTITNVGSLGGGYLSVPMINYPECAILGIHLIRDTPVADNGQVKIEKVLPISVAFDHRIIDGAEAAVFATSLKKHLEDPEFYK